MPNKRAAVNDVWPNCYSTKLVNKKLFETSARRGLSIDKFWLFYVPNYCKDSVFHIIPLSGEPFMTV